MIQPKYKDTVRTRKSIRIKYEYEQNTTQVAIDDVLGAGFTSLASGKGSLGFGTRGPLGRQ